MWKCCGRLGLRSSGSSRYAGEQELRGVGDMVLSGFSAAPGSLLQWGSTVAAVWQLGTQSQLPRGAGSHWYGRCGATRVLSSPWHLCLTEN